MKSTGSLEGQASQSELALAGPIVATRGGSDEAGRTPCIILWHRYQLLQASPITEVLDVLRAEIVLILPSMMKGCAFQPSYDFKTFDAAAVHDRLSSTVAF